MASEAGNETYGLSKHARVSKFDPSKPEDFRAWRTTLKASLSAAANSAIEFGQPTYSMASLIAGKGASEDRIASVFSELWINYSSAQEEVWRATVLYTNFVGSATGRATLETLTHNAVVEKRFKDQL